MNIQNYLINEYKKHGLDGNILKSPWTENTYYITAGCSKDIITQSEIKLVIKTCKKFKFEYYFDVMKGHLVIYK